MPFDHIEATCGLNLDSDDNKIAVGQWAEQNGYTMTADSRTGKWCSLPRTDLDPL